jgi:hypothetical protein
MDTVPPRSSPSRSAILRRGLELDDCQKRHRVVDRLGQTSLDEFIEDYRGGQATFLGLKRDTFARLMAVLTLWAGGNVPVMTGGVIKDAFGAMVTEAGAAGLSPTACTKSGSFTTEIAKENGFSSADAAVKYYRSIGCQVIPDGNAWVVKATASRTPVTQAPAATPAPPPPVAYIPPQPQIIVIKVPEEKKPTTTPNPKPKKAKPVKPTTTTTTLPKLNVVTPSETQETDAALSLDDSVMPYEFSDPTTDSRDRPKPEEPQNKPKPEISLAVMPSGARKEKGNAGVANSFANISGGGDPPEVKNLLNPGFSIISKAREELRKVESGEKTNDQLQQEVMPNGMSSLAWCAAFISDVLKKAGFPISGGGYNSGDLETGALNLMRIFQNPENSQGLNGYKLTFIKPEDVLSGNEKPQAGDVVFYSRRGAGKGHAGIVERYNGNNSVTSVEGNINGGKIAETTRDLSSPGGGLTGFLGIGRVLPNSAEPEFSASTSDTSGEDSGFSGTIEVNVRIPNQQTPVEKDEGQDIISLIPDSALSFAGNVFGTDFRPKEPELKPLPPDEFSFSLTVPSTEQVQSQANLPYKAPPEAEPGGSNNPENANMPSDPRDMTPAQAEQLKAQLEKLPYKNTTSLEEFIKYYTPVWRMTSYLTGAPVEFVAAHASTESNYSNDPSRQSKGWPSTLLEKQWNPWGIKISSEDGCRTDGAGSGVMPTHEGTAGVDRHLEAGNFCNFNVPGVGWKGAAQSYAGVLALDRYAIRPTPPGQSKYTTHQVASALFNGGYMTERRWLGVINERVEKVKPWVQQESLK